MNGISELSVDEPRIFFPVFLATACPHKNIIVARLRSSSLFCSMALKGLFRDGGIPAANRLPDHFQKTCLDLHVNINEK